MVSTKRNPVFYADTGVAVAPDGNDGAGGAGVVDAVDVRLIVRVAEFERTIVILIFTADRSKGNVGNFDDG